MSFQKRTDAQRPSTWVLYRKGLCEGCGAGCCTLPLEVSATDLIRLGFVTEEEAAISLKKVARKLMKARIVRTYSAKTQVFIIEQKHGTDCIFLNDNRMCTVYERRPEVCRQFPKIGPRPGFCPCGPK